MTCLTRVKCHMSRVTTSPDSFSSCYYEAGIFKLDEYAQHEAVFNVYCVNSAMGNILQKNGRRQTMHCNNLTYVIEIERV